MYPGTIFNWYDLSYFEQAPNPVDIDNKPLFMVVSSFDRGTEDLVEVYGSEFDAIFGKMSFERHGQNALQAKRIIDAGARLLVKRVCAEDATIANLVLCATVKAEEKQKVDAEGNPLFLEADGVTETTTDTGTPANEKTTTIKWEASSISGCKSFADVCTEAEKLFDEEAGVFPLFVFSDNGRGTSNKAIRLIPDYNTSKGIGKMFYTIGVYEGTTSLETQPMTMDPSVIYAGTSYALDKTTCVQVEGKVLEHVYDAYVELIAENLGIDVATAKSYDLVYGYSFKGAAVPGLTVDSESIDSNADYGIDMKEGSNGEFGEKPVNTPAWVEAIRAVYAGEVTDEVWDVDQHKICAICDANFPQTIKDAIAEFVMFREDCMFFRDYNTGISTYTEIYEKFMAQKHRSWFISDYATTYQIKDPVTMRNIEVTCMYDLVECLVNHFDAGPHTPMAGIVNSFILKSAIKGTVNFTPIITPKANQKQAMDDIRVNYAIFQEDQLVMQTQYTSQEPYTQLSFGNNVLAIQEVARAVRTACPKNRYTFSNSLDMTAYSKAVNNVLSNFTSNFDVLEFEYTQDKLRATQKIFYASIRFAFGTWAQTEIFDLFAINN